MRMKKLICAGMAATMLATATPATATASPNFDNPVMISAERGSSALLLVSLLAAIPLLIKDMITDPIGFSSNIREALETAE